MPQPSTPGTGSGTATTTKPTATPAAGGSGGTGGPASGGAGVDYEAKYKEIDKKYKDADKEVKQLREAVEQHQRAQNTEVENMKDDFEKLESKAEAFEEFKFTTYLELAVLKNTEFAWYDVEDVRAALESGNYGEVEIDDDGTIKGLDEALKNIAEKKAHLLKPPNSGPTPTGPIGVITPTHDGPSGAQPSGTPGGNADFDTDALKKKYKIA